MLSLWRTPLMLINTPNNQSPNVINEFDSAIYKGLFALGKLYEDEKFPWDMKGERARIKEIIKWRKKHVNENASRHAHEKEMVIIQSRA